MSTRVRRVRPTAARRRPRPAPTTSSYQRSRAMVGLAIFILCFGLLWMVNGAFTVQFMMGTFHTSNLRGWAIHFVMSAIEVAPIFLSPFLRGIPRPIRVTLWLLSLPFGVLDVLSSAVGLRPWFLWTGADGFAQSVQNVALGEVVAFLPEPMVSWLLVAMRNTLRG